jgi:hypothetical protein
MYFAVGQKYKSSGLTMETRAYIRRKNDLKALLALGIKDVWVSFEPLGRFG